MEPECYKVEVLHYINPYLIWVEVPNLGENNTSFEQLGVYGVLPMDMIMDLVEDTVMTQRSSEWMPAATVLMDNVLKDAVEVSFCPIHTDQRSTIFDDNTHKFGEIIIKKPNGKYRVLSKLLVKSGFAIHDEDLFDAELASGNIKTKLSHSKCKEIIMHIEKTCTNQVKNQTKLFTVAESIESALTVKNLEAHNKRTKNANSYEEVMKRKLQDLQKCKDVEIESLGRANRRKNDDSDSSSVILKRKLKLLHDQKEDSKDGVANFFLKQRQKDLEAMECPRVLKDRTRKDSGDMEAMEELTRPLKNRTRKDSEEMMKNEMEEAKQDVSLESDNFEDICPRRPKKHKKPSKSPIKIPDFNKITEARIAFGPPGTKLEHLSLKIVPKGQLLGKFSTTVTIEETPVKKEKEDLFVNEDSDVETDINVNLPNKATNFDVSANKFKDTDVSKINRNGAKTNLTIKEESKTLTLDNLPSLPTQRESSPKLVCEFQELTDGTVSTSILKRKLRIHKENLTRRIINSSTSDTSAKDSSTSAKDSSTSFEEDKTEAKREDVKNAAKVLDSDDESMSEIIQKLKKEYPPTLIPKEEDIVSQEQVKNNVNPFKNVDANVSKFVEKLVTPVLMVHSKMDKRFQPVCKLRDVPFNTHIQIVLKNMSIEQPMMLQTITWPAILRGYSVFMVSPTGSGKTLGYLPAVCRLVSDHDSCIDGVGPSCVIVCATSNSVSEVEKLAKIFLGSKDKVLAIYSGMNNLEVATSLLNGCDLLICTPAVLVKQLQSDTGVDLSRLTTLVLDDCERLFDIYKNEIRLTQFKIKEMLKNRVAKEVKVQYILASRIWCDYMAPLAKKVPDTVICIGAFQECVLYSKAHSVACFVTEANKVKSVLDFLEQIDTSKRTVVVCRSDEEVELLEKALVAAKYVVFACNNQMTVEDLYNLRGMWDDYQEPIIGPILLCCDCNLIHLNITDAHYLVHYSLPHLFSTFCKRFSVLNENYASVFKEEPDKVKIKILLEKGNAEQLPKILHFIKRCTTEVPSVLDEVCDKILADKERMKAKKLVPICDNLLALGNCPNFWNCQERHAIFKDYDEPKDWVPQEGTITFKILHFHSAVLYSAKLLTRVNQGLTEKYPQNYNMLSMKISMYFGRESNRKLHGTPEIGDICAISVRQNFFLRCQVVKILSQYEKGTPNHVLVNLIDEEKLEMTRDIYLYHLPEELKQHQTYVIHVRLANIQPKDKDITFPELAKNLIKNKVSDDHEDLYLRGQVSLTIGNCVFCELIEICHDLPTMNNNTVVLANLKQELLEDYAIPHPEHLEKLEDICTEGDLALTKAPKFIDVPNPKKLPTPQWAHLEKDDLSAIYLTYAEDPYSFFVRLEKFTSACNTLTKDIQNHVAENPGIVTNINEGDIVLARMPEDGMYERARIDKINDDTVKCFFVDEGDWWEVSKEHLIPIADKFITQLPFQAIECRLVGVKPPGDNWTQFATNWFTNYIEDNATESKVFYVKYFTKETAIHTEGHKYGVVLYDTNSDQDIVINDLIIDLNLAQEKEDEIEYLNQTDIKKEQTKSEVDSEVEEDEDDWENVSKESKASSHFEEIETPAVPLKQLFPAKPIRSVPLVGSDESDSEDRWHINMTEDFMKIFKPVHDNQRQNAKDFIVSNLPAIKNTPAHTTTEIKRNEKLCKNQCASTSDSSISVVEIPSRKIKELDSDDLTTPDSSQVYPKAKNTDKNIISPKAIQETPLLNATVEKDPLRKPKLLWRQNKTNVFVKIQLIGVENYDLTISDRNFKFYAEANETCYGFDLELYGIVDHKKSLHSNKGQYISVNLVKLLNRNWLTLTKGGGIQKWIVYDAESIDVSSEEEEEGNEKEVLRNTICRDQNSESEDEEFKDDANFRYSR